MGDSMTKQKFIKKARLPDKETQRRRDAFFRRLDEECREGNFRRNGGNLAMDIPDVAGETE